MTVPPSVGTPRDEADIRRWERLLDGAGGTVLDLQIGAHGDIVAVTRLGLFRSQDGGERWTRIEAPPLIQTLHRADGWWLGTDIGLFRVDRLDGAWQPVLSSVSVTGILFDEQRDLVLAATSEDGLLRSEDRGKTWEDANPGLPGDDVVAIQRSPAFAQDQTIFVATTSGVFRSRNAGRAWREVSPDTEDIQCFAGFERLLVVGTGGDGLWVSADAGRTWSQLLLGESIVGFGASAVGNAVVLSESSLFTGDVNGGNLRRSSLPPDALCAIETSNGTLVGTIGRGVLRHMPHEDGWVESATGLEATARDRVRAIGKSGIVTTSALGAILHSADGGASWSELPGAPLESTTDFDVRVDATNGLEIIACDRQVASVYRGRWERLEAESPVAVAWLDRDPLILAEDGQVIGREVRSRMLPGRLRLVGARLLPVRGHPALIWSVLHTENAGVFVVRSSDGAETWEPLLQTDTTGAVSLAVMVDRSGDEVALVAVGNRVYRLLESPEPVWVGDDAIAIAAIAFCPDVGVLLATSHGLLAATQDLATGELVAGSLGPLLDVDVDGSGDAIALERGGTIWRLRRTPNVSQDPGVGVVPGGIGVSGRATPYRPVS